MDEETLIGREINHHRIVAKIAEGGFGSVFKAENVELKDHFVAIKILHGHRSTSKERDAFRREAQTLVGLEHPYILPFIDYGIDKGFPYLITKYAYGSLHDLIHSSTNLLPTE